MKNSLVNLTFSGYSFIHSFKELYFRYLFNFLYLFSLFSGYSGPGQSFLCLGCGKEEI